MCPRHADAPPQRARRRPDHALSTQDRADVYWYSGDSVVNPSDFDAGEFYARVPASAAFQTVSVDVSPLVSTLRPGGGCLGIRISTATSDRYNLDQNGAQPPRLEVLSMP
ncbi:hypothetical protein WME89_05220 [Sorangium sp. So ce321]|uniref:hypothetical protein n=1 Tax=Sorangium sp. So ce321 TaxID=3133300 RepID=UPI003F6192B0